MNKIIASLSPVIAYLENRMPTILAISALVISYLVTDKTLSPALGTLLQAIISLLTGGTVAAVGSQTYKDIKIGKATIVAPPQA